MFASEQELEAYLRELIARNVTARFPHVYALDNKSVTDIVICRDGRWSAAFFLEVKLFQEHHGRMGIGAGRGAGIQPELVDRAPDYFERHLHWILVDGRKVDPCFVFVPTGTLREYLAGGELGKKFNNIRPRIFEESTELDESSLIEGLIAWLSP